MSEIEIFLLSVHKIRHDTIYSRCKSIAIANDRLKLDNFAQQNFREQLSSTIYFELFHGHQMSIYPFRNYIPYLWTDTKTF